MSDQRPRERFGFCFSVLGRQWRRVIEQELARAGLTDANWAPLIHLQESGDGITQRELAARVGIDDSSLVRLLDIVERKGLIERRVDEADRRARLILLTEAGRNEVVRIRGLLARAEVELLADLEEAEIETMLAAFGKIARRLREFEDRLEQR